MQGRKFGKLTQLTSAGGLTALDLSCNDLKVEGVTAVCEAAIQSNKETKLASLNMGASSIGPIKLVQLQISLSVQREQSLWPSQGH